MSQSEVAVRFMAGADGQCTHVSTALPHWTQNAARLRDQAGRVRMAACLLLLQVLLRQVLEVTLGEGDVRGDSHLRLVPRDRDHVTKVAGLARHLNAVLQKLLLRSDRARRGRRWAGERASAHYWPVCLARSVPCAGHGAAAHEGRSIHDAVIHRLRAVHGELQRLLALHNLLHLLNRLRAEGTARLKASKVREVAGRSGPPWRRYMYMSSTIHSERGGGVQRVRLGSDKIMIR
jgi:hypothetical protein